MHLEAGVRRSLGTTTRRGLHVATWNGHRWSLRHLGSAPDGADVNALSCASLTACVAVGIRAPSDCGECDNGRLVESWNGSRWSLRTDHSGTGYGGVSCVSAIWCSATGEMPPTRDVMFHWNGKRFSPQQSLQLPPSAGGGPTGVSCISRTACITVGSVTLTSIVNGIKYFHDAPVAWRWNGTRWADISPPNPEPTTSG